MASLLAQSRDRPIYLEVKPASTGLRLFTAIVCIPIFAVGAVAAVKLVIALAAGTPYLPYQWIIATGIATLFTVIPAIGIYVALRGVSSLCLDPEAGRVVLTKRFAFGTRRRRFPLAAMPEPEVHFYKGNSEDPPSFGLVVNLPGGGRFSYIDNGPLSLREEEMAMETLCEQIRTMIANAIRREPGRLEAATGARPRSRIF